MPPPLAAWASPSTNYIPGCTVYDLTANSHASDTVPLNEGWVSRWAKLNRSTAACCDEATRGESAHDQGIDDESKTTSSEYVRSRRAYLPAKPMSAWTFVAFRNFEQSDKVACVRM